VLTVIHNSIPLLSPAGAGCICTVDGICCGCCIVCIKERPRLHNIAEQQIGSQSTQQQSSDHLLTRKRHSVSASISKP
jgi:hypothetical protein